MDHTISSSSYRHRISSIQHRLTDIFISPTTHIFHWRGTSSTWTFTPSSILQPLKIVSVTRAVFLLLPPCPAYVRPPMTPLACAQVPIGHWGIVCSWSLCLLCAPPLSLPVWFYSSCHLLVFGVFLGGLFRVKKQGDQVPPLPDSRPPQVLALPRYLAIKDPSSPPLTSPYHHVVLILSLPLELVGRSAISRHVRTHY